MELKAKIGLTILSIIGFFILKFISKRNNKRLKKRLLKINPELTAKSPWLLSEDKQKMLNYIYGFGIFIFIILIWTNQIRLH